MRSYASPQGRSSGESREHHREGIQRLTGGAFRMGSERFYPEETPTRIMYVDPFWIDETPVTNRKFAHLVDATGYRALAENAPDPTPIVAFQRSWLTPGPPCSSRPMARWILPIRSSGGSSASAPPATSVRSR